MRILLGLPDPQDKDTIFFRNVRTYLPSDIKSRPIILTAVTTALLCQDHMLSSYGENSTGTYLNLWRRALQSVVQHGQHLGSDVITRSLLQDDVQVLQQNNCRLDGLWYGEHVPGTGERTAISDQLCNANNLPLPPTLILTTSSIA